MTIEGLIEVLPEPPDGDSGVGLLLEFATAIAFLRRDVYPSMTVWDAVEGAIRAFSGTDRDWSDPDPLRTMFRALAGGTAPTAIQLSSAIRRWLDSTSAMFNDGLPWGDKS